MMNAARQMGFHDQRQCPYLCKLASDYIRKEEGCEEDMFSFFGDDPQADSLFIKLVEEFERCILSYFAFHWSHASFMISQVQKRLATPVLLQNNIFMLGVGNSFESTYLIIKTSSQL